MNLDILWKSVKRLCDQQDVTITQLEKDLGFSPGSMTKWRQSAPSIEKVIAVSKYFRVTIDELCGIKTEKNDEKLQNLISYTKQKEIQWLPCSIYDLMHIHFYPSQMMSKFDEMYTASYASRKYFLGKRENFQYIEYYESMDMEIAFKIDKNKDMVDELWVIIHDEMEVLEEKVLFDA
ncbi:MAG TPA: helix-turn-helix domain-containing protein [Candidatus Blautia faecipullorum]|nr:helix-turn-helix domain-containing protein [Candidatus Blautia faecipullorum]